jgi:alpha-aminoadipate/glutamate carrier protein LysW
MKSGGEVARMNCTECSGDLTVPNDAIDGEIVTCGDCGTSFELDVSSEGVINLKTAESVGEDWGE